MDDLLYSLTTKITNVLDNIAPVKVKIVPANMEKQIKAQKSVCKKDGNPTFHYEIDKESL